MADKYSDWQLKRLTFRANLTPDQSSTTTCINMEYPSFSEWPMRPIGNNQVPDEEFYSLFAEALECVGKEVQDRPEWVPGEELALPDAYPAPLRENGEVFSLLHPDFLSEALDQAQLFIMNGKGIKHEDIMTHIGMTEEASIIGDEAVPALYLASITALMWTLYALDACDTDVHVGWHSVQAHASVYVSIAQVIKTQARVAQNVLKGPDFAALAASVKAAAKRRLDDTTFPDTTPGNLSAASPTNSPTAARAGDLSAREAAAAPRPTTSPPSVISPRPLLHHDFDFVVAQLAAAHAAPAAAPEAHALCSGLPSGA